MAVYNLSGSGVQGLSANVAQVIVEITSLPPEASTGHAAPTDYFGVGFLRFGVQGSYYRKLPIDGFNVLFDAPAGATSLGYNLFPQGAIRVTEILATTAVANWQKQPWDRNALLVTRSYFAVLAGGTGDTTQWTYTVPTTRSFLVGKASAELSPYAAATGTQYALVEIRLNNLTWIMSADGGRGIDAFNSDDLRSGPLVLPAGTVLTAHTTNANTGGSYLGIATLAGTEFDA